MSKNESKNNPMFAAFQNLNLHSEDEQGESRNENDNYRDLDFSNSNQNLNIRYNFGHVSVGGSDFSASNLRALLFHQPCMTQPSSNLPQKSSDDLDREFLYGILDLMKSPSCSEFLGHLARISTYDLVKQEILLTRIRVFLTRNNSTFLDLALNRHGSRSLRFFLRRNPSLDGLIFQAVCRNFFELMNSNFGRYLIIPLIRAVDNPMKEVLYHLTYENTLLLAEKVTGCVALNAVFQEIRGQYRDLIFERVAQHAVWLAFDPYGTHVVQNFLTLQNPRATQAITDNLYGSFIKLAMVRQGSYVVEKCMNTEYGREKVFEEFRRNGKEWVRMANDRFGNFVAQNALRMMKQRGMRDLVRELVEKLRPHFEKMKFGCGRNTLGMIHREIESWLHAST